MAVYIVCYDLVGHPSGHDYTSLYAELAMFSGHGIQESVWLIATIHPAKRIKERLAQHMHQDDRLWVNKVHANRADHDEYDKTKARAGTNDWLRANPPT